MIIQCCVCKKIKVGEDWVDPPEGGLSEEPSHGHCPPCYEQKLREIAEYHAATGTKTTP